MADLPKYPRFNIRKVRTSSNPWEEVNKLYRTEIDGLIKLLFEISLSEPIRNAIRKYLVVVIFAALDYYFRNAVSSLIDKNDLRIDSLFPSNSKSKLNGLIKDNNTTKGNVVASTYRFVDIYEIDFVFSNLLGMYSFLDYIIKQNDPNQTRFVLDGHPIPIEYEKLTDAYRLRNEIAHEIKEAKISKSRIIAIWDNFLNIMDISRSVFRSVSNPELRSLLDSGYKDGKDRARKKAIYKLCSDKIMSKLLEKGRVYQRTTLVDEVKVSCDKILTEKIDDIISRMSGRKEELIDIQIDRKVVNLTLKGEKRFKRTTKIQREKWKREISDIVCTWIPV